MRCPLAALSLLAVLIGCDPRPSTEADGPSQVATTEDFPERIPGGGTLHLVRVVQQGDRYGFEPDTVVALPGDGVRFIHTGHQPESVAFDRRGMDGSSRAALEEQNAFFGRLLIAPGAAFEVRLEGLSAGEYRFFSRAHAEVGAEGVLLIRDEG